PAPRACRWRRSPAPAGTRARAARARRCAPLRWPRPTGRRPAASPRRPRESRDPASLASFGLSRALRYHAAGRRVKAPARGVVPLDRKSDRPYRRTQEDSTDDGLTKISARARARRDGTDALHRDVADRAGSAHERFARRLEEGRALGFDHHLEDQVEPDEVRREHEGAHRPEERGPFGS